MSIPTGSIQEKEVRGEIIPLALTLNYLIYSSPENIILLCVLVNKNN
jgi:hypothetical protein